MSNQTNRYYYNQLNKAQQAAYHAIYEGLKAIAPSFAVPMLSPKELADIYFLVRLDHPEVFWSVKYSYRFYKGADNVEMIPEYMFQKKQILDHKAAMESRVKKLVRGAEKMNEAEKELYIHDFICANVHYDKLKKPYSHEIIGALGNGVAVCEGIAKAVKILCDNLGIWCIVALSEANPEKGIKYRHAWNVIKINGKYYHLDATFDNTLGKAGVTRYDYFNLCDKQLFRDHEPVIWKIPECTDGGSSYYQVKKISFTKMEEVKKRALQAAKKKKPFLFHWRGGYMPREILEELLKLLKEAAEEKDRMMRISLNWAQSVILAVYEEKPEVEKPSEDGDPTAGKESVEATADADIDKSEITGKTDTADWISVTYEEANEGELYEGE